MSELNALNGQFLLPLFPYTKVLKFPQSTKFLGKKTKIISLYMSTLERVFHELYYLIFTDGYLLFVPCPIRFCHVSNLLLLQ